MLKKVYLLAGMALILSGCEGQKEHWSPVGDQPWKTRAERLTYPTEITFPGQGTKLSASQKKKIYELFEHAKPEMKIYARVQVSQSVDPKVRHLIDNRVADLKKFLINAGLKENDIEVFYREPMAVLKGAERNTLLLMLDQYKVIAPKCPGWSAVDSDAPPHGEEQFGCITERNFAQMVAEPRDLYKSHASAGGDGPHEIEAIKRYRTDKIKELKIEKIEKKN